MREITHKLQRAQTAYKTQSWHSFAVFADTQEAKNENIEEQRRKNTRHRQARAKRAGIKGQTLQMRYPFTQKHYILEETHAR